MKCNIDRRGSRIRVTLGVFHVIAALLLAGLLLVAVITNPWWWLAALALAAAGAFMIFEGANGWCAVRAMGFHTPF